MEDQIRGLYQKYHVERTDGSSGSGGKHEFCDYYVLDLVHDPFALVALEAYAKACSEEYPQLSLDLHLEIEAIKIRKLEDEEFFRNLEKLSDN